MKNRLLLTILTATLISGLSLTAAFAGEKKETDVKCVDGKEFITAEPGEEMKTSGTGVSGLPKLGKAENLSWAKWYERKWDGKAGEYKEALKDNVPGSMYFEMDASKGSYQGNYLISVYKKGVTEPVLSRTWGHNPPICDDGKYHIDNYLFIECSTELESGTYYFTIKFLGDGINYTDGDTVTSGEWTWTKPSAKLPTPINLRWDYPNACFNYAKGFYGSDQFEYVFSKTEDPNNGEESGGNYRHPMEKKSSDGSVVAKDGYFNGDHGFKELQEHGSGYYFFKARNLSFDINNYLNSDWTDFSPGYNMKALVDGTNAAIDSVDTSDRSTIRSGLEGIGQEKLKAAMSADQKGDSTVAKIKALEDKCGGQASISVDDSVKDQFSDNNVSIIGANLNGDGNAALNFGSAKDNNEIPPSCKDNAVTFSMTLTGVENPEKLKVPVQLILPVPTNMNPKFLKIIHFRKNGGVNYISPYIYEISGKKYAKFVITSFSDFAFVEEEEEENSTGEDDKDKEKKEDGSGTGTGTGEPAISVSDNKPMDFAVEERGDFKISYNHAIPFFGKAKPKLEFFGDITVAYNGAEHKVTKIKVNKKKAMSQQTVDK